MSLVGANQGQDDVDYQDPPDMELAKAGKMQANFLDQIFSDEEENSLHLIPPQDPNDYSTPSRTATPQSVSQRSGGSQRSRQEPRYEPNLPRFTPMSSMPTKVRKIMEVQQMMENMKAFKKVKKSKKIVKRRDNMIDGLIQQHNMMQKEVKRSMNQNKKMEKKLYDMQMKIDNPDYQPQNGSEDSQSEASDSQFNDFEKANPQGEFGGPHKMGYNGPYMAQNFGGELSNRLPPIGEKYSHRQGNGNKLKKHKENDMLQMMLMMQMIGGGAKKSKKEERQKYKLVYKAMEDQERRLQELIKFNAEKKERDSEKARTHQMLDKLSSLEERLLDHDDNKHFSKYKKKASFKDLLRVQQKYQKHMIQSLMQIQGKKKKLEQAPLYIPVPIRDPAILEQMDSRRIASLQRGNGGTRDYHQSNDNFQRTKTSIKRSMKREKEYQSKLMMLQDEKNKLAEMKMNVQSAQDNEKIQNLENKLQNQENQIQNKMSNIQQEMQKQIEEQRSHFQREREERMRLENRAADFHAPEGMQLEQPKVIRIVKVRKDKNQNRNIGDTRSKRKNKQRSRRQSSQSQKTLEFQRDASQSYNQYSVDSQKMMNLSHKRDEGLQKASINASQFDTDRKGSRAGLSRVSLGASQFELGDINNDRKGTKISRSSNRKPTSAIKNAVAPKKNDVKGDNKEHISEILKRITKEMTIELTPFYSYVKRDSTLPLKICTDRQIYSQYDISPLEDQKRAKDYFERAASLLKELLSLFKDFIDSDKIKKEDLKYLGDYITTPECKNPSKDFHFDFELDILINAKDKSIRLPIIMIMFFIFHCLLENSIKQKITETENNVYRFNMRILASMVVYYFSQIIEPLIVKYNEGQQGSEFESEIEERKTFIRLDEKMELIDYDNIQWIEIVEDYIPHDDITSFSKAKDFSEVQTLVNVPYYPTKYSKPKRVEGVGMYDNERSWDYYTIKEVIKNNEIFTEDSLRNMFGVFSEITDDNFFVVKSDTFLKYLVLSGFNKLDAPVKFGIFQEMARDNKSGLSFVNMVEYLTFKIRYFLEDEKGMRELYQLFGGYSQNIDVLEKIRSVNKEFGINEDPEFRVKCETVNEEMTEEEKIQFFVENIKKIRKCNNTEDKVELNQQ